jgi:ParB family transcriptional regulator, chromosome partitioning protein
MSDVGNSEPTVSGDLPQTGVGTETSPGQTTGEPVTMAEPSGEPAVEAVVSPAAEPEPAEPEVAELPLVHKHFTAPALIPLDRLEDDVTFLVRSADDLEDVSSLATDLARLGQLFPIDVRLRGPEQFQIITGFRRVAALRFLQREKVLARLHTDLSDGDALLLALASAIHSKSVDLASLLAVRERLENEGLLTAAVRDMFEKALATESSLGPEQVEEEVDADELAGDVTVRLGECNQDLALLADVFDQLDDEKKDELLRQLRYSAELVTFLEGKR